MSLEIKIVLPDENVSRGQLAEHMSALGFVEKEAVSVARQHGYYDRELDEEMGVPRGIGAPLVEFSHTPPTPPSVLNKASAQQTIAKRERGKPAPGRARRTKEEIEEDNAADAADAAQQASADDKPAMTAAQAEALRNPNAVADTPETETQDAADEKAEADANRSPEKTVTQDDLRQVMGAYVKTYGMAAAQEDGPVIFNDALGAPPQGEEKWKLSLVPEGKLETAINAWTKAVNDNPFDRVKGA